MKRRKGRWEEGLDKGKVERMRSRKDADGQEVEEQEMEYDAEAGGREEEGGAVRSSSRSLRLGESHFLSEVSHSWDSRV